MTDEYTTIPFEAQLSSAADYDDDNFSCFTGLTTLPASNARRVTLTPNKMAEQHKTGHDKQLVDEVMAVLFVVSKQHRNEFPHENSRYRRLALDAMRIPCNVRDVDIGFIYRHIPELENAGLSTFFGYHVATRLLDTLTDPSAREDLWELIKDVYNPFSKVYHEMKGEDDTDFSNLSGGSSSYTGVKSPVQIPSSLPTLGLEQEAASVARAGTGAETSMEGINAVEGNGNVTHQGPGLDCLAVNIYNEEGNDGTDFVPDDPPDEPSDEQRQIIEQFLAGEFDLLMENYDWDTVSGALSFSMPIINSLLFHQQGDSIAGREGETVASSKSDRSKENRNRGNGQPRNADGRNVFGAM